jgi:HEAT repeat protein
VRIGKRGVEPLIVALKYDYDLSRIRLRRGAVEALGEIGDHQALKPLIDVLRNGGEDPWVRRSAAWALSCIQGSQAVEPLITALQDEDVRNSAIRALGNLKEKQAVEPLIQFLQPNNSWWDIADAAIALGKIDDRCAVPSLFDVYWSYAWGQESGQDPRPSAVWALGQILKNQNQEFFIHALQHENIEISMKAAEVLGQFPNNQAVEPLIRSLQQEAKGVRECAAIALGRLGDHRAVTPLIVLLEDPASDVRKQAIIALGRIGNVCAVEPLIRLLQEDQDRSVCTCVIEALRLIGDLQALPYLRKVERRQKVFGNNNTAAMAREAINQIKKASAKRRSDLKNTDSTTS